MPAPPGANLENVACSLLSTRSSVDEDEVNRRLSPYWCRYRNIFRSRGFQLDTRRDVKAFYRSHSEGQTLALSLQNDESRSRICESDDDDLCPDAGLPENLFRGRRTCDGNKVIVKAVHPNSRELDIIRFLSTSPIRDHPMNHCIPVLDLIEVLEDKLVFIVMEEWSSQFIAYTPCCLTLFMGALRQCIEHMVFMHDHHIAHLDISLHNLLTDYNGRYACIDYELSRRFDGIPNPQIHGRRGTEIPPEYELGDSTDPYKVDVWALAVVMLRACKLTGYYTPELMQLIRPMLRENPVDRPSSRSVLEAFHRLLPNTAKHSLHMSCPVPH